MFRYVIVPILCAIKLFANPALDSEIQSGVLENGLTYYIRENHYPKEKAFLGLIVKVGSLHESDEERGVAHFIEHMNFRGGKHFQDGEVIQYLESIGAWFGPDVNAYTSFDSTFYTLDIPLDSEDSLDKSMLILRDFAGNAILQDETIEKERNVVLDELHHSCSSSEFKLLKKTLDTFLPETALPSRLPIGTKEVVSTVDPQVLRAFYKKWYRADRMAVIAVGDFNAQEIEQKINDLFHDVPASSVALPEPKLGEIIFDVPKTLMHFDPELSYTRVMLNRHFLPNVDVDPETLVRQKVISDLLSKCFQKRALKLEDTGLFLQFYAGVGPYIPGLLDICCSGAVLFSDSAEEAMKAFYRELHSILKYGFTDVEWNYAQQQLLEECAASRKNLDKMSHAVFANRCKNLFLNGEPILSPVWDEEKWMKLAQILTLEECNAAISTYHFHDPFHILFATSDPDLYEKISESSLENIFRSDIPNVEIDAHCSQGTFTCTQPVEEGSLKEEKIEGVSKWSLSNEMLVYLLQTELENDHISVLLQSDIGLWDLSIHELNSGRLCDEYLRLSGLNGLSYAEFISFLQSRGISMGFSVSTNGTYIWLSSTRENLETVFQLMHELFQPLKFDRSRWPLLMSRVKEMLKQEEVSPEGAFYRYWKKTISQNHPFFQPLNPEAADVETAEKLASYFFGRPQDFTAIIVGDFDESQTKELTKKYLASLPVVPKNAVPKVDIPSLFPEEIIAEDFVAGHHTYERVEIDIPLQDSKIDQLQTRMLCKLLQKRLTEVLRMEKGGTYGAHTFIYAPFRPFWDGANVNINFTCQKQDREMLMDATFQEINRLKSETISEKELTTLKQLFLKDREQDILSNFFWESELSRILKMKLPFEKLNGFEEEVNGITAESLKQVATQLFASPHHSILIHIPEE